MIDRVFRLTGAKVDPATTFPTLGVYGIEFYRPSSKRKSLRVLIVYES
jgi:hypothetical protein